VVIILLSYYTGWPVGMASGLEKPALINDLAKPGVNLEKKASYTKSGGSSSSSFVMNKQQPCLMYCDHFTLRRVRH